MIHPELNYAIAIPDCKLMIYFPTSAAMVSLPIPYVLADNILFLDKGLLMEVLSTVAAHTGHAKSDIHDRNDS